MSVDYNTHCWSEYLYVVGGRPGSRAAGWVRVCMAFCFCPLVLPSKATVVTVDWWTAPKYTSTSTSTSTANASYHPLAQSWRAVLQRCWPRPVQRSTLGATRYPLRDRNLESQFEYAISQHVQIGCYGISTTVVRACFIRLSPDLSASQGGQHLSII